MTKRLVDVDDELVGAVRSILGTDTLKDTVNAAMAAVLVDRQARVAEALDHLAELGRQGVLVDRDEAW